MHRRIGQARQLLQALRHLLVGNVSLQRNQTPAIIQAEAILFRPPGQRIPG